MKNSFLHTAKSLCKVIFLTIALLLTTDLILGNFFLNQFDKKSNTTPYIDHNVYDHTLKKNFKDKIQWTPGEFYNYCTDNNGFRIKCEDNKEISSTTNFDIAFIGDSFTEGIGVDFEKTFVGIIKEEFKDLSIANLAVTSYSPSVYYIKLNELIKQGYSFKNLFVYVDISDVHDEAKKYKIKNNKIVRKKNPVVIKFQKKINQYFPVISKFNKKLKNVLIPNLKEKYFGKKTNSCTYLDKCYQKSSWTYNNTAYDEIYIEKGIHSMEKLYELLKKNNINLSIGIYPWPGQLLYDTEDSKQVKIWKNFCENKCDYFINNFPIFFDLNNKLGSQQVIKKYFINGDVHFNENGNSIIASSLSGVIKKMYSK